MKLRMANRSRNGGPMPGPDEFHWVIGPAAGNERPFASDGMLEPSEIVLPCRGGKFSGCVLRVTTGPAAHPVWHWDGNIEAPTLTPSIGCDHRCGWHGNLTAGVLTP